MTKWTVLLITAISGPAEGVQSRVLYPSLDACYTATRAVSDTLAYEHSLNCEESDIPSSSIRPKRNPIYGG